MRSVVKHGPQGAGRVDQGPRPGPTVRLDCASGREVELAIIGAWLNLVPWWSFHRLPDLLKNNFLARLLLFLFLSPTRPIDSAVHRAHNRFPAFCRVPIRVVVDEVCDFEARRGIPRCHKSRPSIFYCLGSVRGAEHIYCCVTIIVTGSFLCACSGPLE